ncbi:MAG: hypothetical protein EZS26_003445 [Candidatus Ordinivivax streblomastigis]|uniref:Twin-arginine translocation signal domain-containing protein n=1 Tax=Candidatus Ordinivivax streblomastigis TaxID=2540710 RepID=A0A5M8NU83_9BACT|nr:MAG: hypothetical protein EZS26_003445 [Candidatus Ordinivivax streblomastigis]
MVNESANFSRRDFMKAGAALSATMLVPPVLSNCSGGAVKISGEQNSFGQALLANAAHSEQAALQWKCPRLAWE